MSLFSTSEKPYRPRQALAPPSALARHPVPSHWVSLPVEHQGVEAFPTTDQRPSQEEEWKEVRGVRGERKRHRENGCIIEPNLRLFRSEYNTGGYNEPANTTLSALCLHITLSLLSLVQDNIYIYSLFAN